MSDTSAVTEIQIEKALLTHVKQAIKYGCEAIHGMEPLVPFAMIWHSNGERTIERCRYGTYEDSVEHVLKVISQADDSAESYAAVWEGYVKVDEQRLEAVIVEAAFRSSPEAIQMAQLYTLGESAVELQGDLMFLGKTQNLLTTDTPNPSFANHLIRPSFSTSDNVCSQPFAQMVVAALCVAANQFEGEEQVRITSGIHALQNLEQYSPSPMSRRVFSVLLSQIAEGDLMTVLPTDSIDELIQLMINGSNQLDSASQKGLVLAKEADQYREHVKNIMTAVLTREGSEAISESGQKLLSLFDKVFARAA